jgi:hypothetical protein
VVLGTKCIATLVNEQIADFLSTVSSAVPCIMSFTSSSMEVHATFLNTDSLICPRWM